MLHIIWLRNDLRTRDNPPLYAAALNNSTVLPVFIWPDNTSNMGSASRWWLHHSLIAFSDELRALGSDLLILSGSPAEVLLSLAKRFKTDGVFWSRAYDPESRAQEDAVERALRQAGISCRIFAAANHLVNPADIWNKSGAPFKVFTPFYKHASALPVDNPLPKPVRLIPPAAKVLGKSVKALGLEPTVDWAAGLRKTWQPGEKGATNRLSAFLEGPLQDYKRERDFPGHEGTSRLSPHLHFGEISPRMVYYKIQDSGDKGILKEAEVFLRQLYWREFAHHLLYHFPYMSDKPMYAQFEAFPWREDAVQLRTWQRGKTGYPIVDAGMLELWATGWMHNRVRMIVGSFLVKDLLLPWQHGAAWFRDTLVDADAANNTLGWQWVGGCGPDAAPYFRIFNPVLQSKRFDPDGLYIKKWLPELSPLCGPSLHAPWTASPSELQAAGIVLGKTYPLPLVEHAGARDRALIAYNAIKAR